MRDVKRSSAPVCTFFRPSCVQKTRLTNESDVSSPSNRRISALCAGGGAGRPKACCPLGRKTGSSVGAPALQASGEGVEFSAPWGLTREVVERE